MQSLWNDQGPPLHSSLTTNLFFGVMGEFDLVAQKQAQKQAWKEREELDRMVEENERKVAAAQRREALEQQPKEEERYRELVQIQREKEEALLQKKMEDEEERASQMKLLGKNKSRPKLSFALGSK